MTNVISIAAKNEDDYFKAIKEYKFDTILTIGVHRADGGSEYRLLPSHDLDLENALGMLDVASHVLKFGGGGDEL